MNKLHIDIETAPNLGYFWEMFKTTISIDKLVKPGYTLCFSAKWDDSKEIMFSAVWTDGMQGMLLKMHELLDRADAVVHYNGTKFDIPTINKEFIKWGIKPPTPYHQIDLYQTVRRNFRFSSNKLDFVCRELGIGAKVQHKGFSLWEGCMAGDPRAQRLMERYNKQDVRLLPKLYKKVLPWIKDHPNHALYVDTNRPVCPNCGSHHVIRKGIQPLKTQSYERFKCKACNTNIQGRFTILPLEKRKNVLTQIKL